MSGGTLPRTGTVLTIGAATMTIPQIAIAGAMITVAGIVILVAVGIRFGFRRSRAVGS